MNHFSIPSLIEKNLHEVQAKIATACERAGRHPDDVKLVAVTKYAQIEWVHFLLELGIEDLGESRPQQLDERASMIAGDFHWHLIGSLQRNKIRKVLPVVKLIHSVDSFRLLEAIDRIAAELGITTSVLLELNLSGEAAKHGFEVLQLRVNRQRFEEFSHLKIDGLMTMAARVDRPEAARTVFRQLRELRDDLADEAFPLKELSMGMSGDFEIAIEEGATLVRIGSLLYEGLVEGST